MRRIALLGLTLTLSGCGYNTWSNPPFSSGRNPNAPLAESDNIRRVMGETANASPLTPEPGDIWPGPLPPSPTMQDLERLTNPLAGGDSGTAPPPRRTANPLLAPMPSPAPYAGSATPVPSNPSRLAAPNQLPAVPNGPRSAAAPPPAREPGGRIIQTPSGQVITNGGTPNYQTTTTPGGGSAIVVPNGNGTSTIIHSNGRIETVPTPR